MNEKVITDPHHHIVPLKVYIGVGIFLYILTAITVAVSLIHLGSWNIIIALSVAGVKAILVALFYMHLRYDKKIFLIIFGVAVLFLVVFISITLIDSMSRGEINPEDKGDIEKNAVIYHSKDKNMSADSLKIEPEDKADSSE